MSTLKYYEKKKQAVRYPAVFVDILLDKNNTDPGYGPVDFYTDPNSYDTPKTTDSQLAYNPNEPKKAYRFSSVDLGDGSGVHFPILDEGSITSSSQLKVGKMSVSSSLSLRLFDIETNDVFELRGNYSDRRVKGSLLRKLDARNYIENREVIVYRGFLDPGEEFDIENFESERYIIKEFNLTKSGATVSLVDPVFKSRKSKGKAPIESNGTLLNSITNSATSLTISSPDSITRDVSGTPTVMNEFSLLGEGYPAKTYYLKIEDEIIRLSSNIADQVDNGGSITFNNVQRAQYGTIASSHDDESKTEKCLEFTNTSINDALIKIMREFLNIKSYEDDPEKGFFYESKWIENTSPSTDPDDSSSPGVNFGGMRLNGIVSKPETALKVIDQLLDLGRGTIFWDAPKKEMVLVSFFDKKDPSYSFNYETNINQGSMVVRKKSINQKTRKTIKYGKRDYSKGDNEDNFLRSFTYVDGIVEDESNIGTVNIASDIVTSYLGQTPADTQYAVASVTASIERDSKTPVEFTFKTDVESVSNTRVDSSCIQFGFNPPICTYTLSGYVWIGKIVDIFTDEYIGPDAKPINQRCIITSLKKESNGIWEVKAETFEFDDEVSEADYFVTQDHISSFEFGELNLGELFPGTKPAGRPAVVVIESGVSIYGTEEYRPTSETGGGTEARWGKTGRYSNPFNYNAIRTGNNNDWPNGLKIINKGAIIGAGGVGGEGGAYSAFDDGTRYIAERGEGWNGGDGGDAILVECDNCIIDNSKGIIWAGGGGAGGNGEFKITDRLISGSSSSVRMRVYGSGGGSGAGGSRSELINNLGHGQWNGYSYGYRNYDEGAQGSSYWQEFTERKIYESSDGPFSDKDKLNTIRPDTLNSPKDGGDFGQSGKNGRSASFKEIDWPIITEGQRKGGPGGKSGFSIRTASGLINPPQVISGDNSTQMKGRRS